MRAEILMKIPYQIWRKVKVSLLNFNPGFAPFLLLNLFGFNYCRLGLGVHGQTRPHMSVDGIHCLGQCVIVVSWFRIEIRFYLT